jgi:hypothetical protein
MMKREARGPAAARRARKAGTCQLVEVPDRMHDAGKRATNDKRKGECAP